MNDGTIFQPVEAPPDTRAASRQPNLRGPIKQAEISSILPILDANNSIAFLFVLLNSRTELLLQAPRTASKISSSPQA